MNAIAEKHGMNPHAELLGEIVTWDMGAMEVPFPTVITALESAKLPTSEATSLRAQTAFRRAIKDLHEGRAIDRVTRDTTTDTITFQFTRKHLDDTGLQLDFAFEALCHLDTADGSIVCEESPEIEEHARKMFKHAMEHRNTSDVTRLVQRMFTTHADLYPINPRKGVAYFVPEAHRDFSARIETFLESLGGRLLRFPVPTGTEQGNKAVKTSIEEGLKALSTELAQAVEQWDEKTRQSTFAKAIERWTIIKYKAEAYSEYLGDRQDALLAILDEQKTKLAAKVAKLTGEQDARKHDDALGQRIMFPGAMTPIATGEKEAAPV